MTGTKKRGLSAGDRKERMTAAKETALAGLKKVPCRAHTHLFEPPPPPPPPGARTLALPVTRFPRDKMGTTHAATYC